MRHPKKKLLSIALITLTAVCAVCGLFSLISGPKLIMPGADKKTGTANILVFEDANGNGKQDEGEGPLRHALIIAHSNIHGGFSRQTFLSDAEGVATVTVTYTHYFDIGVLAPCGYTATTSGTLSAAGGWPWDTHHFGFQADAPSPPQTNNSLQFQLWEDVNNDGKRQPSEPPLPNMAIVLDPGFDLSRNYYDFYIDDLTQTTDANGLAAFEVGTACGVMEVQPPDDWLTTVITPATETDDEAISITYGPGQTEIFWGLRPTRPTRTPTPTVWRFAFAGGGAYHPEGMGEWQLQLDNNGVFSGHYNLHGQITPFGPVTLDHATGRAVWKRIAAANIPSLPHTFQRPGIPDEVAYTFTLTQDGDTHTVEMWMEDARQNENLAALIQELEALRETHDFIPPPTATP
jgi:hypothetical protein